MPNAQPVNRREFLAAAGGFLAAPGKIRTGILGIQHSHLTGKLAAMRHHPDFEVVGVCEPDSETRRTRGQHQMFAGLRWMELKEMLNDRSLDLIVFEGEVKDAIPFGRAALVSGKHLHLEKPPSREYEPFRELVDLAQEKELKLQLGYVYRFHAGVDAALEAYRQGWLGELLMLRATMSADIDAAQRMVEARYPGGTMFELGGHMIDRVIALLGRPVNVRPWLRHDTKAADSLRDNTLAVLEYPKALATVVSSAGVAGAERQRSFEVTGTDGSMLILPMEPVPVLRVQMRRACGPYQQGLQEVKLPPQPRFIKDFEDLARAIREGRPLRYSYDHELLLQETLLRASGEMA